MSKVSVLGCGRMGSALIEALATADTPVTIWNRTRDKAEALAGPQVTVADTVADALAASPTTFICLSNYDDAQTVLDGYQEQLVDTTIVQLSSGRPDEAEALAEFVTTAGGAYVDGVILGHPEVVGTDDLLVYYAGDSAAFEEIRTLLEAFGGTAQFVGEQPRDAAVREVALTVAYHATSVGLSVGAMVCEREGLSLDWYVETLRALLPGALETDFDRIQDPDTPTDPKRREDVRVPEGVADNATYLRSVGIDSRVHEAIYELYAAGFEEVPREPGS